jgi:hypothetical protein
MMYTGIKLTELIQQVFYLKTGAETAPETIFYIFNLTMD